jgi:hypothetical protein
VGGSLQAAPERFRLVIKAIKRYGRGLHLNAQLFFTRLVQEYKIYLVPRRSELRPQRSEIIVTQK